MRLTAAIIPLAIAGLALPSCSAQAQSAAEPNSGETVLHTTTNLVLVDVVVTGKGKAIHNLDRSQFHVFEDGHERPITSFDEHDPAATPAAIPRPAMIPASLPANTYSNFSADQVASAANVLLLDELNTPPQNLEFLRQQMIEYMGTVRPGTRMAIFALTSELRMVKGFTSDIAQTTKALQNMKPEDFGARLADRIDNNRPDFYTRVSPRRHDPGTDERPQITLEATMQLARYLGLIPGRKNLIWFAGRFPVAFDPGASLSAAHVAVYPVDALGIASSTPFHAAWNDETDSGGLKADAEFHERTKAEHAAMEQFAEQTGGEAYFNTNGLKEAIASAVENGSSYYTIGYVPAAKKLDGKFRAIKVHVDNGGYELAYRRGYFAAAPDQTSSHDSQPPSQMTESVVHGAPAATEILFRARVLPATDPLLRGTNIPAGPAGEMASELKEPMQLTIVDVTLDSRSLALNETSDGAHHARVEFSLVAYDASGKRLNYLIRGVQFNIMREIYERTVAEGVPVRLALDLPAGESSLRIAIYDLSVGRVGSLEVPVTVAAVENLNSSVGSPIEAQSPARQAPANQVSANQVSANQEQATKEPGTEPNPALGPVPNPAVHPAPNPPLDLVHAPATDGATAYFGLPIERLKFAVPGLKGIKYDSDQEKLPVILAGVANKIAEVLPRLPDLISREDVNKFQGSWDQSAPPWGTAGEPSSREFKYLLHCLHNSDGSTTIPRQPQPRFTPAAMLPVTRRRREDDCFGSIIVHRSDPLTLELPSLRRNHARRRTALRRATPASLATATRPVRSMKLYPHPRPLTVLRRVRGSFVSSVRDCSAGDLFSPTLTSHCGVLQHHPTVKAAHPTRLHRCPIPLHSLRPIQST
ncbi:MAG: VWA domain-containing protein [Terracidiphilus sp.]